MDHVAYWSDQIKGLTLMDHVAYWSDQIKVPHTDGLYGILE